MCTISTPARCSSSSIAIWCGLAGPEDAKEMAFGFALASASKSASEAAGNDGFATSSSSKRPVSATGAKSRAGS
jgi:hypothetical protein